jgi:tetratricopeptide (TPR) repeat protein
MTERRPLNPRLVSGARAAARPLGRPASLVFALTPVLLAARGLAENQPVPPLNAPDLGGIARTLADYPGTATLILFWNPSNQRSRAALCAVSELAAGYQPAGLVTVVSGPAGGDEIGQALEACKIRPAVLLDAGRKVFGDYQIIALPTLLVTAEDDHKLKHKFAGFGREAIGDAQTAMDALYGRQRAAVAAPEGSPEAIRRYGMAQKLLKAGMKTQAEGLLEALTKSHPEFRPAWVAVGYRRIAADRADDAGQCFEKALAMDQGATDVAAGMAWLAWKKGNRDQAKTWLGRVPADDPNRNLLEEIR